MWIQDAGVQAHDDDDDDDDDDKFLTIKTKQTHYGQGAMCWNLSLCWNKADFEDQMLDIDLWTIILNVN